MKSKRYPNLHKYPTSPYWIFRKYSKEKRKEFVWSTKIEKDEARAYKVGLEKFNDWLGVYLPSGRQLLVRDLARAICASKKARKANTYRSFYYQIESHVVPAFGHLRPDQVTPMKWNEYDTAERAKGERTKLSNTRQALVEILRRAFDEGMIRILPKLKNHDGKAAPPREIKFQEFREIRKRAAPTTRLLSFIMWYQGPRPTEACQYSWPLIDFSEGPHGVMDIPAAITKTGRDRRIPLNARVSRVLRWIRKYGTRIDTDAAALAAYTPRQRAARRFIARSARSQYLLPAPGIVDRPMMNYKSGWNSACRSAGHTYSPYNLRDTFITQALKRGKSAIFIGKYCDNSAVVIERRYAVAGMETLEGVAG